MNVIAISNDLYDNTDFFEKDGFKYKLKVEKYD